MTIPSSPIAQKPAKIGTRYIAVERVPAPHGAYIATTAASHKFTVPSGYDLYPLLDPTDAAELERLRGVEDDFADTLDKVLTNGFKIDTNAGVVRDWREARANRIAFEKKIGGGS